MSDIVTVSNNLNTDDVTVSVNTTTEYVTVSVIKPAGPAGATGPAGPVGPAGASGVGVPVGGSANQVLSKIDGTDYNTQWTTPTVYCSVGLAAGLAIALG